MKPVFIVSTYPNKKSILKIANELVKNKTIACVNISKIDSVYSWNGKIQNSPEYIAIFKTVTKNKIELKKIIEENFNLSPRGIREMLELNRPIYEVTSAYGHFGRKPTNNGQFTWEKIDKIDLFKL